MTPKERQAMETALDALKDAEKYGKVYFPGAIAALREALAEQAECPHGVDDGACKECYMEQAEQEPVAWHHPQCDGQCIACLIEKAVQDAYGTQGRDYMLRHINAAAYVRTKDLTPDEITALIREGAADGGWQDFAQRVIAADREKNNANNNT